jgi:hypothetical protein
VVKLTPKQFVVCDDIRREMSGKEILVGVYGSDIAVAGFPTQLALSYWVQVYSPEAVLSPATIDFRLMGGEDAQFFAVSVQVMIPRPGLGAISLPAIPFSLQIPTRLILQMRQRDGDWEKAGEFGVDRGTPLPNFSAAAAAAAAAAVRT